MKRVDALNIVAMIVTSWPGSRPWQADEMDAYAHAIEPLDAEHTVNAVARAVNDLKYRPSVAELREYVRLERSLAQPEPSRPEPSRFGGRPPEWMFVWSWLRYQREPPDLRGLPQQDAYDDDPDAMSMQEYARLREEWLAAGAPKLQRGPLAAAGVTEGEGDEAA